MRPKSVELEIELATEKEQLRTSLARLGARANDAMDWRQQFRRHPAGLLGAALAAGVVVGAATGSAKGRSNGDAPARVRGRTADDQGVGAWDRVVLGVSGMLADRAIVAAQKLVDGFLEGSGREPRRERPEL
jgi:hypothetical protein